MRPARREWFHVQAGSPPHPLGVRRRCGDRGLLNRIGGLFSDNPTSEHALQAAAVEKVAAAAEASGLRSRAEQNTRAMLTAMLGALGFDEVEPPRALIDGAGRCMSIQSTV